MYTLLYLLAALILAGLAVPLVRLLGAGFSAGLLGALIVTLGLVYDNGILAAGSLIGEGPLLENLNWARYVIHAFGTPLLIIYALHAARSSDLGWARPRAAGATFWLVTLAMIAYGIVVELLPLSLEAQRENGILSYAPVGGSGFPLPAVVTIIILTGVGMAIWRACGFPWLGVLSLLAIVGFSVGPALDFAPLEQFAEIVLVTAILITERWLRLPALRRVGAAAA